MTKFEFWGCVIISAVFVAMFYVGAIWQAAGGWDVFN